MLQVPSRSSIVLAQQDLLREIGIRDKQFAKGSCWACISEQEHPIRARISLLLQEASPRSYFLLCYRCSQSRPLEDQEKIQLDWIIQVSTSPSFENISYEFMRQTNVPLLEFVTELKSAIGSEALAGYLTEKLTREMLMTNHTRREVFLDILLREYAATTKRGNQNH